MKAQNCKGKKNSLCSDLLIKILKAKSFNLECKKRTSNTAYPL